MSDRIEKLLRDGMNQIPDVTPPPGQWEKIRRRDLVVPRQAPARAGWWVLPYLLLGVLIGVPAGYFFADKCSEAPQMGNGDKVVAAAPARPSSAPVVMSTSPLTPAEIAEQKELVATPEIRQVAEEAVAPYFAPEGELRAATFATRNKREQASGIAFTSKPAMPAPPEKETVDKPRIDYNYLPLKLRPRVPSLLPLPTTTTLAYQLERLGGNAGIVVPDLPQKPPNPKGRWEVGAHLMPGLTGNTRNVQVLSSIDNGRNSRAINFNGEPQTLYPKGSLNPQLTRRFRVELLNLEIGRQFSNGLRLGLGLAWWPSHSTHIRNDREIFSAQLLEDEWATYLASETEELNLGLSVGYTFRRRKRLRPYLGLYLGSRFYRESIYSEYAFRRADRSVDIIRRFSSRDHGDFGNLFLFAQAGLQYQIGERLSVGLEVVPGLGVGGRYQF